MKISCAISLLLLLSGCMVGPNYRPPDEPMPLSFTEDRLQEVDGCEDEDLAHWWTFFDDPFLDTLLAQSLQGNFDWRITLEQICQARAAFWIQTTALLPEVDADLLVTRSRTSETLVDSGPVTTGFNISPIQAFYQAGVDAIWQIDLFGGLRRAARAAYDQWEATVENARGVRIMLLSEVARIYTTICALQQTQDVAIQTIVLDQELLQLSKSLFTAGLADEQNVEGALANLESDRAALLVIETNLRQAIYSLAILLGRPPETLLDDFTCARPIPYALGRVPIGLPSDLLRRRPDIRGAERKLAASVEQIGVAVANLFPQVSLTGSSFSYSSNPLQGANYGFASNEFNKWFTSPSRIWGVGVVASVPLFDFGKRLAMIDEQVSLEHQTLLQYQKTVIGALQEVESDLVAYFNEEARLAALLSETEAYRKTLELTTDLYQAGLADYNQALLAKERWLTAVIAQLASQQALTTNLIALYKALGGGWECSYTP